MQACELIQIMADCDIKKHSITIQTNIEIVFSRDKAGDIHSFHETLKIFTFQKGS